MKGWIVNLVLLVLAIALGVYVYLKPNAKDADQHPIATLAPVQVKTLKIERAQGNIALEKRDNLWFMVAPMAARADAGQVNRLLDVLSVKSKEKLAKGDLSRFDLDKPSLTILLDGHRIAFGTTNTLTNDQYVESGDNVYLIPAFYGGQIPAKAESLLTHSLFSESEKIAGFELSHMAAEKKDGKWTVTRQDGKQGSFSQDDLNRWADDWRFSSSLLTQPYDGTPGKHQVRVRLEGGKVVVLEVLQDAPEVVIGRADEKLKFQFASEAGKRLLDPKPEPLPDTAKSAVVPGKP